MMLLINKLLNFIKIVLLRIRRPMELDEFLKVKNDVTDIKETLGFSFDTENERGVVNNVHLKDFSFSKASGGTVNLGGASNGNGVLSIKNTLGSEIVRGDSSGLTINDGNLTVKDSSGTTIVDSTGLVSTANFGTAGKSGAPNGSLTIDNNWHSVGSSSGTLVNTRSTNHIFTLIVKDQLDAIDGTLSAGVSMTYALVATQGTTSITFGPSIQMQKDRYYDTGISVGFPVNCLPSTYSSSDVQTLGLGSWVIDLQYTGDPYTGNGNVILGEFGWTATSLGN